MDKAVPPKTVLETILEWSEQRPAWQRDALRRIVSEGTPDEASILELVALCKKGKGAKDEHATLVVIDKNANFRSADPIVQMLNRMRPDLPQMVSDPDAPGEARVFHNNAWPGLALLGDPFRSRKFETRRWSPKEGFEG